MPLGSCSSRAATTAAALPRSMQAAGSTMRAVAAHPWVQANTSRLRALAATLCSRTADRECLVTARVIDGKHRSTWDGSRCSLVTLRSSGYHLHVFLVIHSCQPLCASIFQRQHAVKLQDAVKVQQQTINVQTCIMESR